MTGQKISVDIPRLRDIKSSMSKGEYKASKLRNMHDPETFRLPKPRWIKAKAPKIEDAHRVRKIKSMMRELNLHSVCEEASCPNLSECFGHGTATFMIMGDICTRRCPFCDVAHGRPKQLDENEPANLAKAIGKLGLKYVVITSVDRDDLRDGGAFHFAQSVRSIRNYSPDIRVEILVPDFRGCEDSALEALGAGLPDVFNHNLETVPRIYKHTRPGADYEDSMDLLESFKLQYPNIPTKSGIMVGLGETIDEVLDVMRDLRSHDVDMLTVGQYLQPSKFHLPVERYVTPEEFSELETQGYSMGFSNVAAGPMVRSSYHADLQARMHA